MGRPRTTGDASRRLIDLRHAGESWRSCSAQLRVSPQALQLRARRLRDAGEWVLADGRPARGAPQNQHGKRGRPRAAVPRVSVSLRLAPDVRAALRTVAARTGVRPSEAVLVAVRRSLERAGGRPTEPSPFAPIEPFALAGRPRSEVVTVSMPQSLFAEIAAEHSPATTAIVRAVHELLAEIGYQIVCAQ